MNWDTIVLDFDGTMCLLFKNFNLQNTVCILHNEMKKIGVNFPLTQDAFDVFDTVSAQIKDEGEKISAFFIANEILTAAELEAVDSCKIVPGLIETIEYFYSSGISIGIASNNSEECIKKFIGLYFPNMLISVTGRIGVKPDLMKPCPWSLKETISKLQKEEKKTVFVGDTKRDYLCATQTKCRFFGMAPTEKKKERLLKILPSETIFGDYYELQNYLKTI